MSRRRWWAQSMCVSLMLVAGCSELAPRIHFQVDKNLPDQVVEGSITPCQLAVLFPWADPFQMTITQEADFPEQDTDVQHITKARIDSLRLSLLTSSAEPTWDFLDALEVYVEAQDLEKRLVASIGEGTESDDPIPDGATTLDLDPAGVNLAPYLKANGGFTLSSEATGCPPENDATFDGRVVLNITAKPL